MLRFNKSNYSSSTYFFKISIHPMLRFNHRLLRISSNISWFQYILCYGSTYPTPTLSLLHPHFNTSYVTVQPYLVFVFGAFLLISIHPMLRFNFTFCCYFVNSNFISIHPMLRFNFIDWNKMQMHMRISIHPMLRFNCKFGIIMLLFRGISIHPMLRFNTKKSPNR